MMAVSSISSTSSSLHQPPDSTTTISDLPDDPHPTKAPSTEDKTGQRKQNVPLDLHIELGTLTVGGLADESENNLEWTEYIKFLPQGDISSELFQAVVKLWKNSWIRVMHKIDVNDNQFCIWRIHILPNDVARGTIDRDSKTLRKCADTLLASIDVSAQSWFGEDISGARLSFDIWSGGEECSLFYLFNTLPSPDPEPYKIPDRFSRTAVQDLLEHRKDLWGLKSSLYPYQRRAAAMMVQREVAPHMQLDPRLEFRKSPSGRCYCYSGRDRTFFLEPKTYDTVLGGILAETMGLGKTLICIILILTTKGHLPRIPPQYNARKTFRPKVGSLLDMSAGNIARYSTIPWRQVFDGMKIEQGIDMAQCIKAMEKQSPAYEIPPRQVRSNRSSDFFGPSETIHLSGATIIVVPRNLVHQWQSEFTKHLAEGTLKVYVNDDIKMPIPRASELLLYDVILLSRQRFEYEFKITEELYESPLKAPHWLRIIIDEGHGFSSATSHAAMAAERHIRAERRWIVSGTPAKDLLGVEVETMTESETPLTRSNALEQRKYFDKVQETNSGAIKALGTLASRFLKVQPWCSSLLSTNEAPATWDDYVYRHEDLRLRTYTSFSTCLRRTLESLVVKTQPEDVERDLTLPPLTHDIVRLEPSVLDKYTANLFILVFTSNAITSERTDMDYLFHKSSQAHLQRLIHNLRQSGFIWTGFKESHVEEAIRVTEKYLAKETAKATAEDRILLRKTAEAAQTVLSSPVWKALSRVKEVGLLVSNFPTNFISSWSLQDCSDPMVVGLQQLRHAQKHVNARLATDDPLEGFNDAGIIANAAIEEAEQKEDGGFKKIEDAQMMVRTGVPKSSVNDETGSRRLPVAGVSVQTTPKKQSKRQDAQNSTSPTSPNDVAEEGKRAFSHRSSMHDTGIELTSQPLADTQITGTTSAKASYLISRIQQLHRDEKILVFYDGNNIAYYLSEALDLLHIKHLIYANTLSGEQRSKYIVLFNEDAAQRVLLMDIRQAAHGLNLSSASRVFFVNPPCRPNIEAQAIKRAHRIGQTKPVFVETLILKGTIEEAMHDRAAKMTTGEHLRAKNLEEDEGIRGILQQAKILEVKDEELQDINMQMAKLALPEQVFGRTGRLGVGSKLEEELFGDDRPSKRRKTGKTSAKVGKQRINQAASATSNALASGVNANMDGVDIGVTPSGVLATAGSGTSPFSSGTINASGYVSIFGSSS